MKIALFTVLVIVGSLGTIAKADRTQEEQSRLANGLGDYYLLHSAEAIQNLINDKAPHSDASYCKEIGIFFTQANALEQTVKYSPDVKKYFSGEDMKEYMTLRWYATDLQAFCGDAMDGESYNKTREGNRAFLVEQLLKIKPHLNYVLKKDKEILLLRKD